MNDLAMLKDESPAQKLIDEIGGGPKKLDSMISSESAKI